MHIIDYFYTLKSNLPTQPTKQTNKQRTSLNLNVHVSRWINTAFWELGNLDIESGLDISQDLLISFRGDKGNSQTLGTESTSSTDSVSDLLGQSGREEHDLLFVRSGTEDLLDVTSHGNTFQHLVTLVNDEVLDVVQSDGLVSQQGVQTAWCGNNNVWSGLWVLQQLGVVLDWSTTVENSSADFWHVLGETLVFVTDLVGQFTGVTDDNGGDFTSDWFELL
ncbi:hypothetical protein WICPIJ_003554 [Wickerhamomyces pijperi]|uniref:Uncharacterized protein n=1 Tax=Wickerhamomyces pijperi TaxID=599730 RepID=A0A9P8TNL1_WICPI|nr:hypothetical protein WICPIJ_003554 [Wickerhamomyces pijperi]